MWRALGDWSASSGRDVCVLGDVVVRCMCVWRLGACVCGG